MSVKQYAKELPIVNGKLAAYAWPGMYPLFYFDADNMVLCVECARDNDEDNVPIVSAHINWEDEDLYCEDCNESIESAYGEDND
jgi:hypothetical protein